MLNYADLIIAAVLIIFVLAGVRQGLLRTFLSLISFFVAVLISEACITVFKNSIPALAAPGNIISVAMSFGLWLTIFILLELLFSIIFGKVIKIEILGPVGKLIGAVLGALKGLLLVGFIILFAVNLPLPPQTLQLMRDSRLTKISIATYEFCVPFAKKVSPKVTGFLQKTVINRIDVSRVNDAIPEAVLKGDTSAFENVTDPEKKYLENIPQLKGMKVEDAQKLLEKYQKDLKSKQK